MRKECWVLNATLRIAWKFIPYIFLWTYKDVTLSVGDETSFWPLQKCHTGGKATYFNAGGCVARSASRGSGSDVDEAALTLIVTLRYKFEIRRPREMDVSPYLLILCISKISWWIWTIVGWQMNLRHNHEITSRRLMAYLLPTPPGGPKSQKKKWCRWCTTCR